MSRQILDQHRGQVPHDREELMALPGIGRKCTDILLNFTFAQPSIAVDTHVKRVVQRLGIVEDGASAERTADVLNEVTSRRYTEHAHEWLIQHGMKTCKARNPRCGDCPVQQWCSYASHR